MSLRTMFTDVDFVGVDAKTTDQQLIAYLKPRTKQNAFLLKQIPKTNTSRTKIVTARTSNVFCHVVPLDDTTIISLQDISIAKIFSVENTVKSFVRNRPTRTQLLHMGGFVNRQKSVHLAKCFCYNRRHINRFCLKEDQTRTSGKSTLQPSLHDKDRQLFHHREH
jgi:hypothetical protein